MKTRSKSVLAGLFAAALTCTSFALGITPATVPQWSGNQTSQNDIDSFIAPIIGTSTLLYKNDVGTGESGSLAGSYETVFLNTPTDPSGAIISYVGGTIVGPTAYLLVKDGNSIPAWYLFDLTALGWNGTETLELSGFWPNQGAISHVSLYGGPPSDVPGVPEGGSTVALLGAALMLIGGIARRGIALA